MDAAAQLMSLLVSRGLRLATAESLTGGGLGAALTTSPGSSAVYLGGVVAYSNAAKTALLGVLPELLVAQGAVSGPVAAAMAEGILVRLDADLALATTGLAGPEGDGINPVGTVWIARAARGRTTGCWCCRFTGSRQDIRAATVARALALGISGGDPIV